MIQVAINVSNDSVDLVSWDGAQLLVEKRASEDLERVCTEWVAAAKAKGPCEVLLREMRVSDPAKSTEYGWFLEQAIRSLDQSLLIACGNQLTRLRKIRPGFRNPDFLRCDPGIAAARLAADQRRLGRILAVEAGVFQCVVAVIEPNGDVADGVILRESEAVVCLPALTTEIHRIGNGKLPVIVYGERVEGAHRAVKGQWDDANIVLPHHATSLAAVGMLCCDIERVRGSLISGECRLDLLELRAALVKEMDKINNDITRLGYDVDDAVCDRFALLSLGEHGKTVTVSCDRLSDESGIIDAFRRLVPSDQEFSVDDIRMRGVGITARIMRSRPPIEL